MEPLNPVQIERDLRTTSEQTYKGVDVVSNAYADFLDAEREYKNAYAMAYLAAEGSIKDKEAKAEVATEEKRAARDVADVAYKRAKDMLRAVIAKQSALQTMAAGIRQAYAGSGYGQA